jgi:hypothetical protein
MEQKEELRVSLVNTEAALATAANTLKGKEFEQSQDRLKMQKLTQVWDSRILKGFSFQEFVVFER